MPDEEIDLNSLSDADLTVQMHQDLYDGLKDEVVEGVNILLERGWTPYDVLTKALVEGMRIVGIDFRDGILFVPEVLLAANAMKAGMAILRPLLEAMPFDLRLVQTGTDSGAYLQDRRSGENALCHRNTLSRDRVSGWNRTYTRIAAVQNRLALRGYAIARIRGCRATLSWAEQFPRRSGGEVFPSPAASTCDLIGPDNKKTTRA